MTDDNFVQGRESLSAQILHLEERCNIYKKKSKELESTIQTRDNIIIKLRCALQLEKFKSNLYAQLLTSHTELKLNEILEEAEDGLHVYNYENGNIPVFVHDYINGAVANADEIRQYTIPIKKKILRGGGTTYRSVKNRVEIIEEKPQEQEEKIKQVEESLEEILQKNNLDVSYNETIDAIENLFEETIKSRTYTKPLISIRDSRSKLLGKLDLNEYIKLVNSHVKRLEEIFTKKKYDQKKISATIVKSLSPLDQRLIFYGQYYNSELQADDTQRLQIALRVNTDYPRRYVPFNASEFYEKMYNYSISIFPLRETLKRILVNPYGFSNIVYLDMPKSTEDDPYSFYILEKVEADGKRCWKMELRLDEFSKTIAQHIQSYCISLFRKIYMDIYNDNMYREDYREKTVIGMQDCEQLLINIIALSKQKSFCNVLRNLIVKHCTIHPTQLDRFNLTADDKINKRHFAQETDSSEESTRIMKRLFDEISDEDAEKICSLHMDE